VGVHDELHQPQDLTGEMEGVTKARLLPLLGGEGLGGLEVEVVVQVQVWREGEREGGREGWGGVGGGGNEKEQEVGR